MPRHIRKRDIVAMVQALQRENAVLKGRLELLQPKPEPKPEPKKPASRLKAILKPKAAAEKPKAAAKAKEDAEPNPEPAGPWDSMEKGPLAKLTKEQLAAQYGSVGYDDLISPIHEHDRDWRATSKEITEKGLYPPPGYM